MSLVIAGDRSGTGKTTITLALLSFLTRRGFKVQSFKVGPDYIDPMFHHFVTGRPCRNLDPVLTSETYVRQCFARHLQGAEFALTEGVMGLFDGLPQSQKVGEGNDFSVSFASTAHIALLLNLPILFAIDCSRLSGSVAAIVHGFCSFHPRLKFAGLVLNRVGSDRHLELLKDALEPLSIPILGVVRRQDLITIPDRHLGLIPTDELANLQVLIERLADLAATCFNWEKLLPLLATNTTGGGEGSEQLLEGHTLPTNNITSIGPIVKGKGQNFSVRIAVARDRAFSFYYPDNLDLLQQLGAELVFWSPLDDSHLPSNIHGLYLGGGFPEVFAQELSNNAASRQAVQAAILAGMPTYAECGGLMYLCEAIVDFEGNSWPGVGILPTAAVMGKRLTLGYKQAVTFKDSPLFPAGVQVCGHEFHRSHLSRQPSHPLYQLWPYGKRRDREANPEGWQVYQLHASYLHLHWGGRPEIPAYFLQHCLRFHSALG
ncbi:MAG: cobyrinate a,c-diamide synthase [Actinomycetota bacterium]